MLLDKIQSEMREAVETADYLTELTASLKAVKALLTRDEGATLEQLLEEQRSRREKKIESLQKAGALSKGVRKKEKHVLAFLQEEQKFCMLESGKEESGFVALEKRYREQVVRMKENTAAIGERLHALFVFLEKAFPEGNEMLIFVTELTVNDYSARFIGMFGSEDYRRHNEELLISERKNELQEEIAALEL